MHCRKGCCRIGFMRRFSDVVDTRHGPVIRFCRGNHATVHGTDNHRLSSRGEPERTHREAVAHGHAGARASLAAGRFLPAAVGCQPHAGRQPPRRRDGPGRIDVRGRSVSRPDVRWGAFGERPPVPRVKPIAANASVDRNQRRRLTRRCSEIGSSDVCPLV
jgi:hypothetical protein